MTESPQAEAAAEVEKAARIGVLGAGVSGRSAARVLLSLGKEVVLIDDRDCSGDEAVAAFIARGARGRWGRPDGQPEAADLLNGIDLLVLSPGFAPDHPVKVEAVRRGMTSIGEVELAWAFSGKARFVAITGTNGKTTVTMLTGHIAEQAGLRAVEAGNIGLALGDAVLGAGDDLDRTTFIVEMSSFQLDDIRRFAPDVAVVLNITPDHLDHHKTMLEYAQAKARITVNQRPDQVLIVNQDDAACLRIAGEARAEVMHFSLDRPVDCGAWLDDDRLAILGRGGKSHGLIPLNELPLIGMHNVANCLAGACVGMALGIGRKKIAAAIESFEGAPHRIQKVGTVDGVEYYNDSKATNVDALIKAVSGFQSGVHLIAGGRDKESPFASAAGVLAERVVRAYLIGEAAEKMNRAWSPSTEVEMCGTLAAALDAASRAARAGDVVLLSPGCASFDQFDSYAHRGEAFAKWVKETATRT